MKRPLMICLAFLGAAALACSLGGSGGDGGGTETSPTPASTILFQDDFSDTSSGWDQVHDGDSGVVTDYANGAYNIVVNTTQYDAWANPNNETFPDDVIVEADATKNAGPDENDFGLICRYSGVDDFYYFHITSDGYAVIGKVTGGDQTKISGDNYETSSAVNTGGATNHLRADCVGDSLTFYVNGQQVLSATDSDHTSGNVGLMAGTFDTSGADILFDNLVVREP